jgi:hypothetical protein
MIYLRIKKNFMNRIQNETKAGEWKWILSIGKVAERNDKNTPVMNNRNSY